MSASQLQSTRLLVLSVPVFLCAAILGYHAGAVAWRRKQQEQRAEEERDEHERGSAAGMQHHQALRKLIYNSTGRGFGVVKRVYVVPGGGPGPVKDAGYPPWTALRVVKALQRYDVKYADTTAFLALGAGSMNAHTPMGGNDRIIFESARIAQELVRGGVPPGSVIADFVSWDTVGNAWFARMAVEAILDVSFQHGDKTDEPHATPPPPPSAATAPSPSSGRRLHSRSSTAVKCDNLEARGETKTVSGGSDGAVKVDDEGCGILKEAEAGTEEEVKKAGPGGEEEKKLPAARAGEAYGGGEMRKWLFDWKAKRARARRGPLNVTVFVSDFHAGRMDAVFQWVFGLEPSLLKSKVTVTTVSIDTPVELWARRADQVHAREAHERKATDQVRSQAQEIRTVEEFRAFMMLGGHGGYFDLTHGRYQPSAGAGWGGTS